MEVIVVLNTPRDSVCLFVSILPLLILERKTDRQTTTHKISNRVFIALEFVVFSYY